MGKKLLQKLLLSFSQYGRTLLKKMSYSKKNIFFENSTWRNIWNKTMNNVTSCSSQDNFDAATWTCKIIRDWGNCWGVLPQKLVDLRFFSKEHPSKILRPRFRVTHYACICGGVLKILSRYTSKLEMSMDWKKHGQLPNWMWSSPRIEVLLLKYSKFNDKKQTKISEMSDPGYVFHLLWHHNTQLDIPSKTQGSVKWRRV